MAQLRKPIHNDGPVNAGEKRLLDYLESLLPSNYYIIPNLNIAITGQNRIMKFWEYDCIVVAPHAIYHIENKDWGGNLEGDDWAWFRSGQEVANPHKTAGLKSRILASQIKNSHPDWSFGQILTAITLSNPLQSKFGLDPQCNCYNQTFTLNADLINFLTSPWMVDRSPNQIAAIQKDLVDLLTGQSVEKIRSKRTEIFEYKIQETAQETEDFTEFLCVKSFGNATYKVREYPLVLEGKNPEELKKLRLQVQNANIAQEKIGSSPYIVKTECRMNEEQTYYYEISQYQDESTLRSKLRQKTFKQVDKLSIILDVANALKAAHKEQVYHRNVCPENIYVYDGGKAALANFGMAWFMEHEDLSFTVSNAPDLKSRYTAPEVIDGDVNSGTDIYSLGVIFYELMTGKEPFDSAITFIASGGVLSEEQMPSKVVKDLPSWMDEVIRHTVVADLDKRWNDIDDFINFITTSIEAEKQTLANNLNVKPAEEGKNFWLKDLKPGIKVTACMTLHEELGKGGFGRVFKVWHDMQKQHLAIKIFERGSSVENAINEYEALGKLNHENIVKFIFIEKTNQGLFYTLMELLDGENLQNYITGDLRLPVNEVYRMAKQVLSALTYMQEEQDPPVFHRDIKPSNIMWHKRQVYKLIDFNIASTIDDSSFGGTLPYMAPDLIQSGNKIDWDKSADTFALGITMYQLLTHAYPWPGSSMRPNIHMLPTDIKSYNDKISDDLATLVMKSIITDRNSRFTTAKEMLEALTQISEDDLLKTKEQADTVTTKNLDPVEYINSLYSQSRHGNGGTRAGAKKHEFDELTYSETKLDKQLIEDIKALKYKLVIITGNAGDGKTAFIHRIENQGSDITPYASNNGSRFTINGVKFESNYDGSQDEDDKLNDDVLSEFLKPFNGLKDYTQSSEGRVIAINEGRLVDFLTTKPELKILHDNIEEYFYQEGHAELLPGLMVINLNLRSVTARDGNSPSLLSQQVKKLTQPALWSKCTNCPIANKCFIKYNVDTFQDSSAGDEVINRLEWLLRTIMYKRELHITMRDLRSMIAWMLTRDYTCDEVKQLIEYVEAENVPEFYWHYYYFNLTSPEVMLSKSFYLPSLSSQDRLIKLLRETDIAGVSLPAYDRDLYYRTKYAKDYLVFSDRKQDLLKSFNDANCIKPAYEIKDSDIRLQFIIRHKSFIRHQYFEGSFDFRRRLPYRYASKFEEQLRIENPEELRDTMQDLARAISASEGCDNPKLTEGHLLLASSNSGDPISKSYRRFALDEFELYVNKTEHLTKYIEYESDSLTFRHKTDKFIMLTVSLDLYEMLQYIRSGFSPSVNDLKGRFIELQIFKNLLEAKTYSEILVTKNNRDFVVVRLDDQKHINIEPLKQ